MSTSSDGRDFQTQITADPAKFLQGMREAQAAAKSASAEIDAQFKRIADTVTGVSKAMLGFTAVLAGGGALKKFIDDANQWNGTAGVMAQRMGVTTQQASVMNVALARLGLDSDTYISASEKMSKQINSNGQAFETLGVKVKDASGAYRPVTEVMGEVNDKLAAIKNPIEQNIAGQQVYGKGWSEVRGILKLTAEQMKASELRARELNLIVGPEGVAMSKQYSAQMRDLNLVGKSLEVQFGNALLPVFARTGAFLGHEGPQMGMVFARVLEGIAVAAQSVWLLIKEVGQEIGAAAAMAVALVSGDFAQFAAIRNARKEDQAENLKSFRAMVAEFGKPIATAPIPPAPDMSAGPHYNFKPDKTGGGAPAEKSRVSGWEAQLEVAKAAIERQGLLEGQYRQRSLAENLAFWQTLLQRQDLTTTERQQLTRKAAEAEMAVIKDTFDQRVAVLQTEAAQYKSNTEAKLRIERELQALYAAGSKEYEAAAKRIAEIERQAAQQQREVAQLRVEAERSAQLQVIALEEQTLQQAQALGIASQAEVLQREQDFEARRFEIARAALAERLQQAEADPDRNPVEVERVHRQVEDLEAQHQLRLQQLRNQLQINSGRYLSQGIDATAQAFEGVVQRIGTSIKSLNQLMSAALQALAQIGLQVVSRMAADWLRQQLAMRIFGKASAIGRIGEEAAKAGAGGVASMAAAPFPLNLSAPEFGAAMAAAAAAFAPLASAAGGYDIPGSINPIVQAHAREMILPAKYADVIRDQAERGGAGGAAAVPALPPMLPLGDVLAIHKRDFVKFLEGLQRDNAWRPAR